VVLKVTFTHFNDPFLNLALDEAILRRGGKDPFLRIWTNPRTVVMGINSSTFNEVNLREAEARGVAIARRFTGGGTVYHDQGNLNYTIVAKVSGRGPEVLYGYLLRGVTNALRELGASPEIRNDTDVVVNERKVSGNAGYISRDLHLLHGTVLVSSDLEELHKVLVIPPHNIRSNVDMVKYRVANLKEMLGIDMSELYPSLVKSFSELLNEEPLVTELEDEIEEAKSLADYKYRKKDFIFRRM
jgi:lipoate-protein ligase A